LTIEEREAAICEAFPPRVAYRYQSRHAIHDALEAAVADAVRWVPVTERLPESRPYPTKDEPFQYYVAGTNEYGNGMFRGVAWFYDNAWYGTRLIVTHWMPLPDLPKE
jgi:hypothetical protein